MKKIEMIIIIVCGIYLIWFGKNYKKIMNRIKNRNSNTKEKDKNNVNDKNTSNDKNAIYNEECVELYRYYKKNNYNINDEETNKIISSSKNIPIDKISEMYYNGEKIVDDIQLKEKEKFLKNKLKKESEIYEKEKQLGLLFGKEKYFSVLNPKIEGQEALVKLSGIMSSSYISGAVQASKPRQVDPYIFGGMAEGIAGSAAGIMTASRIERENAERRAKSKELVEGSIEQAAKWGKAERSNASVLSVLKKIKARIDDCLLSDDKEKTEGKMIIQKMKYEILDTNNFRVCFTYDTKSANILDKEAVLDGSLKFNIYDEEHNLVADGYYNAKNIDVDEDNVDLEIGFSSHGYPSIICIAKDRKSIDDNKNYTIEVDLSNLWLMEKIEVSEKSKSVVQKISNTEETITSKSRLNAIKKFLSSYKSNELLSAYSPCKDGGIIITDSFSLFRLNCNYLPFKVAFPANYIEKDAYIEKYGQYFENVIEGIYPNVDSILDYSKANDEVVFNVKELKEQMKNKVKTLKFKTTGDYEIMFDVSKLVELFKILDIKEDAVVGIVSSDTAPVFVFNEKKELGLLVPIKYVN